MSADNPILNSPYLEPLLHYDTDSEGSLDYTTIRKGRRIFKADSAVIPTRQTGQKEVFEWNEDAEEYITHIINLCRKETGLWRTANYPNTTRVTKELLTFWFNNPERIVTKKLFFAQQEAVETAIWINEVAEKSNAGCRKPLDTCRKRFERKTRISQWYFIEVPNDIRNIKNQLIVKINSI